MSGSLLTQLADAAGLASHWTDFRGAARTVAPDTLRTILQSMELPCTSLAQQRESLAAVRAEQHAHSLPSLLTAVAREPVVLPPHAVREGQNLRVVYESGEDAVLAVQPGPNGLQLPALASEGYHRLELADRQVTLAVAPPRAFGDQVLESGRRAFGIAAQMYALRRAGDGGIGDFTALGDFARGCAAQGADALAVSPVHALFAADLGRFSPYAPSSRLFLNALHVDPAAIAGSVQGIVDALGIAPELAQLESAALIDWPRAARLRTLVLRALFEELQPRLAGGDDPLGRDFARFRRQGGEALEDHARFEAIHAQQLAHGGAWHWRDWPAPLHDVRSAGVAQFAQQHAREVDYHAFLQWLADRGLAAAQAQARNAGMRIGLISDLAVGTDGGGSHAWSRRHDLLVGLSVGAPPDDINQQGQGWGLTTFSPRALQAHGYAPFLEMLRAALRHAGGLRIDHILGLNRLWLVPEGSPATAGAYLKYPLEDLLRLTALESSRHRALIIGEDLGTVPERFREQIGARGLMGMRVLWFERESGLYRDPARWTADAVAMTSTHDLPPVAGWWKEHDIDWRARVGQTAREADERASRVADRRALWAAFGHAGLVDGAVPDREQAQPAVDAALGFVARTPARLAILPIEDLAGLDEQPNLPGTVDEHPNWRRRLPAAADALLAEPAVEARLARVRAERTRGSTGSP